MLSHDEICRLSAEVAKGGDETRLNELVKESQPFVERVKVLYGFFGVPREIVRQELGRSAVSAALTRLLEEGGNNFVRYLENSFRKECRDLLRAWRMVSMDEILVGTENGGRHSRGAPRYRVGKAEDDGPAKQVEQSEIVALVMAELQKEGEPCVSVVRLWVDGYGYREIEKGLSLSVGSAKNERIRNLEHMRSRIEWRYSKLVEAMRR